MSTINRNQLFETLKERGYVYQMTNEENVKKIINGFVTSATIAIHKASIKINLPYWENISIPFDDTE